MTQVVVCVVIFFFLSEGYILRSKAMARFLTDVTPEKLDNLWYRLPDDLIFEFTIREALGHYKPELNLFLGYGIQIDEPIYIIVPKGFVTDLASVPLFLTGIFPRDGKYTKAAILHDLVYQSVKNRTEIDDNDSELDPIHLINKYHTRYLADRIFLMGMRELGVGMITRTLMYNGVRAGGGFSYGINPMEENYGLNITYTYRMANPYMLFHDSASPTLDPSIYRTELECKPNAIALKFPNLKRSFVYYKED